MAKHPQGVDSLESEASGKASAGCGLFREGDGEESVS